MGPEFVIMVLIFVLIGVYTNFGPNTKFYKDRQKKLKGQELKRRSLLEEDEKTRKREEIRKKKITENEANSKFLTLDIEVPNKKQCSILELNRIKEYKKDLFRINSYLNQAIGPSKLVRETNDLMSHLGLEYETRGILVEDDPNSDFSFSILEFYPCHDDRSKKDNKGYNKKSLLNSNSISESDKLLFDIFFKPTSLTDSRETIHEGLSTDEVIKIFNDWILLLAEYNEFKFDSLFDENIGDGADYYTPEQIRYIDFLLEGVTSKVKDQKGYDENLDLKKVIHDLEKSKEEILKRNKGEIKKYLQNIFKVIFKFSKDVAYDFLIDLAKNGLMYIPQLL